MDGTPVEADGLLLVDKPSGPTSHDVVQRARRTLGTRRIGHTGTLDPFASGLLVLCVGDATRLAEYFHLPPKAYRATLRLGRETSTHDRTGEPVRDSDAWRDVGEGELREVLRAHTGRIRQRPPAFSAKRVRGRRAHELAREGGRPELSPVSVTVHALDLEGFEPPDVRVAVTASTGTYVRSLARDVGRRLGCGAHLVELRRTAIGPFRVDRALPEERFTEAAGSDPGAAAGEDGWWRSPGDALPWLPIRRLNDDEARRVRHGARIRLGEVAPPPWSGPLVGDDGEEAGELPVLLVSDSRLLAVAERQEFALQPRKVLAGP